LLADEGPDHILQDDTFFTCDNGRLKLRVIDNRSGSGRSPGCRYEWPRHNKTMTGKNALSASVCRATCWWSNPLVGWKHVKQRNFGGQMLENTARPFQPPPPAAHRHVQQTDLPAEQIYIQEAVPKQRLAGCILAVLLGVWMLVVPIALIDQLSDRPHRSAKGRSGIGGGDSYSHHCRLCHSHCGSRRISLLQRLGRAQRLVHCRGCFLSSRCCRGPHVRLYSRL
jgi:hypothetical protein